MASLDGACVVVLGGTSGIGLATARAAVSRGAYVVVGSRDPARVATVGEELAGHGDARVVDVGHEDEIRAFLDGVGKMDHLLVTPSGLVPVRCTDARTEEVRPALDLRFWAAYHAARYAAPHLSRDGSITFMSGIAGARAIPNEAVAGASCAGVEALMRSLVGELAPVRCNALSPGWVETPLLDGFFGEQRDARLAEIAARLPRGRVGRPEDIADAALFLMGNDYMNGHVLTIDGAYSLT